jgi:hypothetical protein
MANPVLPTAVGPHIMISCCGFSGVTMDTSY